MGLSGYTYVLDTEGIIISHPDESTIGTESTFAASLRQMDNYRDEYLRYEYNGRIKVLYRTYYEPLSWFISVTAYEDELVGIIEKESLKEQILSIKVGKKGYPIIFGTNNKMIIHPNIPAETNLNDVLDAEGNPLFTDMIEKKEGISYYNWQETDGSIKEKYISYKTMVFPEWVVAISGYRDDYFSLLETINTTLIVLSLISVIIILAIVYIISILLVKPINSTTILLKDISRGKGDLTQKLDVNGNDEVSQMAGYFNRFTENLSLLINNVKEASFLSVQIKEDLSANFVETVASLSQVDSNLQNVNNQISEMDSKVNNSTNAVKEIISGITILDSQIQEQAGAVEESTASVTEMVASLKSVSYIVAKKREAANKLVQTSRLGGEQIELTTITFEEGISTKINEISEMTTIIENIASQTNLLSMNAAIEAAHAGDSGKGFAVVADEIRKLAIESTENSKKITSVINTIVEHIGKTGNHVKNTAEAFTSIEDEVKDLDTALAEILNASEELSTGGEEVLEAMGILADISTDVTQKSSGIRENSAIVYSSISEVSEISKDVSNAVNEAASGTAEINTNMTTSQNLIIDLGDSTVRVNSEVGKFKTD